MRPNAHVLFLSLPVVLVCLAVTGVGQSLRPLPPELKVAAREDAPVAIRLNGVEALPGERAALNFSLTNAVEKNIRAVVITGVPGTIKYSAIFGGSLRPGMAETFTVGNVLAKKAKPYREIMVDFVLFDDGTTCGPNTARDGDYLMGVYEGRKAAYSAAMLLAEPAHEKDLTGWLHSPEIALNPPGMTRILNTKWSAGYVHGYSGAHGTFKRDFARRGLFSIGLRLQSMQRDLGLPPANTTAAKPQ